MKGELLYLRMESNTELKLYLEEFNVHHINADGSHKYITSNITCEGKSRKVTIFFKHKYDEEKLDTLETIYFTGILKDDGNEDLLLRDAVLL